MQGTRLSFRSKEDAIHFAEKQGNSLIPCHLTSLYSVFCLGWDYYVSVVDLVQTWIRVDFPDYFQTTSRGKEDSTQELFGELHLQAEQVADCKNKVDVTFAMCKCDLGNTYLCNT
jgi:hypothetical protein